MLPVATSLQAIRACKQGYVCRNPKTLFIHLIPYQSTARMDSTEVGGGIEEPQHSQYRGGWNGSLIQENSIPVDHFRGWAGRYLLVIGVDTLKVKLFSGCNTLNLQQEISHYNIW